MDDVVYVVVESSGSGCCASTGVLGVAASERAAMQLVHDELETLLQLARDRHRGYAAVGDLERCSWERKVIRALRHEKDGLRWSRIPEDRVKGGRLMAEVPDPWDRYWIVEPFAVRTTGGRSAETGAEEAGMGAGRRAPEPAGA